jgi:HSP20 family molecular chaperone IbpA
MRQARLHQSPNSRRIDEEGSDEDSDFSNHHGKKRSKSVVEKKAGTMINGNRSFNGALEDRGDRYVFEIFEPSLNPQNIEIVVSDAGTLTIEENQVNMTHLGTDRNPNRKLMLFPKDADQSNMSVSFRDSVLTLSVPKSYEIIDLTHSDDESEKATQRNPCVMLGNREVTDKVKVISIGDEYHGSDTSEEEGYIVEEPDDDITVNKQTDWNEDEVMDGDVIIYGGICNWDISSDVDLDADDHVIFYRGSCGDRELAASKEHRNWGYFGNDDDDDDDDFW